MSTRSITSVRSRWDANSEWCTNATIYRHHDGYPSCHGVWLHKFLDGLVIVNGIGGNMPERYANGPSRLAAQLVAALQEDGHSPGLESEEGVADNEYHYAISAGYDGPVSIAVYTGYGETYTNEIFSGSVEEFGIFVNES